MLDASCCHDCDDCVEEFIPTDRGRKRGEFVCRLDLAPEDCEIVREYNWDRFVDKEDDR